VPVPGHHVTTMVICSARWLGHETQVSEGLPFYH
jgi:hypothetical protein